MNVFHLVDAFKCYTPTSCRDHAYAMSLSTTSIRANNVFRSFELLHFVCRKDIKITSNDSSSYDHQCMNQEEDGEQK